MAIAESDSIQTGVNKSIKEDIIQNDQYTFVTGLADEVAIFGNESDQHKKAL